MSVPFEKIIFLQRWFWAALSSWWWLKGKAKELGKGSWAGNVPAPSCLWEYSHFMLKLWVLCSISGSCALSLALLAHGPRSPAAGELRGRGTLGFFPRNAGLGRVWETLGVKLPLRSWEVATPWAGRSEGQFRAFPVLSQDSREELGAHPSASPWGREWGPGCTQSSRRKVLSPEPWMSPGTEPGWPGSFFHDSRMGQQGPPSALIPVYS